MQNGSAVYSDKESEVVTVKISVIVAYHGEENYIRDCLASLNEQSYRDFEVVLACDGCEPPKLSEYQGLKVVSVSTQSSMAGSVAAARNCGIEAASGEYLYFLDADDYLEENALEKLIDMAVPDGVTYSMIRNTWYSRKVGRDNQEESDDQNEAENEAGSETENETEQEEVNGTGLRIDAEDPYSYLIRRTKTLQNVSILGTLIPGKIVRENGIRFEQTLHYFSDIPFLMEVLSHTEQSRYCDKELYIKRKHNDPINLPSLLQVRDEEKKIFESMEAYRSAKKYTGKEREKNIHLDFQFVRWITRRISPFMVTSKPAKRKEVVMCLKEAMDLLGEDVLPYLRRHQRGLIQDGRRGDGEKLAKRTRGHARRQTLRRICTSRAKLKRYLYDKVFSRMKLLENTVMLESFFGKSYSDSPKYIFEYLNQTCPGRYKYVWVRADRKLSPEYPAKQVKRFSFGYFYYMARCKYMVFNGRQPQYFIKRKGNVFLETWHGTPLKKLVFDMDDVTTASPLYKEQFYIQTRSWDYLVAPNQFSEDIFRHAFMYDGKMLETGYPRNDILYTEKKEEKIKEIKQELGIAEEKKVILYAPTWRDDEFYGHAQYKFSLKLDLARMKQELGDEYVILLRTHYFIADFLDLSEYDGFAYNLSKYDDIAKLYLISDVLITDYSSVFFDYANLRRPMLFFTYDLEKYRSVLRGFYMNVEEELPGPMLFDTDEVIGAVKNLEEIQKTYADKYDRFCKKYCAWEDGHATEKVVNAVFSPRK